MHCYQVGTLYHPQRPQWPEGVQYNFRGGEHELVLFLHSPSAEEIGAVRDACAEFALYVDPRLLLLCYRFEPGIPWSEAPYSWHRVPPTQRTLPPPLSGEERVLLHLMLVDASTGLLCAQRAVSLSPVFSRALHAAIAEQVTRPWDEMAYDAALRALYANLSSAELAAQATVSCQGGD